MEPPDPSAQPSSEGTPGTPGEFAAEIARHAACAGSLDVSRVAERPGLVRITCAGCGSRLEYRVPGFTDADAATTRGDTNGDHAHGSASEPSAPRWTATPAEPPSALAPGGEPASARDPEPTDRAPRERPVLRRRPAEPRRDSDSPVPAPRPAAEDDDSPVRFTYGPGFGRPRPKPEQPEPEPHAATEEEVFEALTVEPPEDPAPRRRNGPPVATPFTFMGGRRIAAGPDEPEERGAETGSFDAVTEAEATAPEADIAPPEADPDTVEQAGPYADEDFGALSIPVGATPVDYGDATATGGGGAMGGSRRRRLSLPRWVWGLLVLLVLVLVNVGLWLGNQGDDGSPASEPGPPASAGKVTGQGGDENGAPGTGGKPVAENGSKSKPAGDGPALAPGENGPKRDGGRATATGAGGVELAYTDFRGDLRIGLPRGWTEAGTTGDGAVLLRPESGPGSVEVFYESGSTGDIGSLAEGAARFLAGRNPGEKPGAPRPAGGAAEIRAPYSGGYELARVSQQGGHQIFAIGDVPDGTDDATAAQVAAVVRGVKGS